MAGSVLARRALQVLFALCVVLVVETLRAAAPPAMPAGAALDEWQATVYAAVAARGAAPHFVYVASPGRSSTGFLARLLGTAHGVSAHHEPAPRMTGRHLRAALLAEPASAEAAAEAAARRGERKHAAALAALLAAEGATVYAETSNMFVKTFAEPLLARLAGDARVNVSVVVPRRAEPALVRSMAERGWLTPYASGGGEEWYYDGWQVAAGRRCAALPFAAPEDAAGRLGLAHGRDDVWAARLLSYVRDVRCRTRALRARHGGAANVRFVDVDVDALRTADGGRRLLEDLGLRVDAAALRALYARPADETRNTSRHNKEAFRRRARTRYYPPAPCEVAEAARRYDAPQ